MGDDRSGNREDDRNEIGEGVVAEDAFVVVPDPEMYAEDEHTVEDCPYAGYETWPEISDGDVEGAVMALLSSCYTRRVA